MNDPQETIIAEVDRLRTENEQLKARLDQAQRERDHAQAALREWLLEFSNLKQALSDRAYVHGRVAELELKNFQAQEDYAKLEKLLTESAQSDGRRGLIPSSELTPTIAVLEHSAAVHWALHSAKGSVHDEANNQCKAEAARLKVLREKGV